MKEIIEKLQELDRFLTADNWIQGEYRKGESYCLVGAINDKTEQPVLRRAVKRVLVNYIYFKKYNNNGIEHFNDTAKNVGEIHWLIRRNIRLLKGMQGAKAQKLAPHMLEIYGEIPNHGYVSVKTHIIDRQNRSRLQRLILTQALACGFYKANSEHFDLKTLNVIVESLKNV